MVFSANYIPAIACLQYALFLLLLRTPLVKCSSSAAGSGGGVYGGRHSYSLSTFSPSGEIDQVVRAMRASMLGVPIVALSTPSNDASSILPSEIGSSSDTPSSETVTTMSSPSPSPLPSQGGIYLSIPLRFLTTSPFLVDDGTPRVVQLTSSLCITHTGVGADGRALCDFAVKLALDHRYIYGEEIETGLLLEGLAGKVQEMTMKPGSRPFGCALFVGCLGSDNGIGNKEPTMYRVDPSGAVVLLNSINQGRGSVAFLGNWDPLRQKKDAIRSQLENQQFTNERELQNTLIDVARQTYGDELSTSDGSPPQSLGKRLNLPVFFASFTREHGLQISRTTTL